MSKHLFGLVVTPYGVAANNRGENDGNITTLQKLLWKGEVHTTVSAEALRWALRYYWQRMGLSVNRRWNEETAEHEWQDPRWSAWEADRAAGSETCIDDDVLGFMVAEAAKDDGSDTLEGLKKDKKELDELVKKLPKEDKKGAEAKELQAKLKAKEEQIKAASKGSATKRRGPLEVTRAVSLTPFAGDITFNAKSGTKTNTSLYGAEVHATRYQYGFALTPAGLRVPSRAAQVVDAVVSLGEVAGNQSRFLFDFSPEAVVFRWTDDPAPRILFGFGQNHEGHLTLDALVSRLELGDLRPEELIVGVGSATALSAPTRLQLQKLGVSIVGVKAAAGNVGQWLAAGLESKS